MPPRRRTWAACTDSRRVRWTTGRALVANVRAFPTMGLARRRNAETRLTTQRPQRSSGRVIGLFDGADDRRPRAVDRARSRRSHGRHGPRRVRAHVARRVGRGRERAAVGRRRSRRAATQCSRGIRGRRGGGQGRPVGRSRGPRARTCGREPEREAAMAPRRARAGAPAGAGATCSGAVAASSAAPGRPRSRAGRPRRAPPPRWRRAAIRWRRARRRPRGCSGLWASVPYLLWPLGYPAKGGPTARLDGWLRGSSAGW